MTDTPETIQAALDDLKRQTAAVEARVAAFEKARAEEEEPPALTDPELSALCGGGTMPHTKLRAAARLRYCERELARLREGLKVQPGDYRQSTIDNQASEGDPASREIQRHRALLKDGGGK